VVDWTGRLSKEAMSTESKVKDIQSLLRGVVPKVEETAAELNANTAAHSQLAGELKELRASLNGMAKAVTKLEGEMKTQKSDMKMAVKTIDKVARAQEDMAKRVPMLSGK
jgi:chromosome segregation ATPase